MTIRTRRIVTGHAADGRSIVLEDGAVPHVRAVPGARFDEVWAHGRDQALDAVPAVEPTSTAGTIGPETPGSIIRVIEFAPRSRGGTRSPMHRTRSIDYAIVITGEMVLILSDSEVLLKPGDVVVQRGTDHAWENRSAKPAKMAFVLLDAEFAPELASLIGDAEITA
jgi:quercetin dioxygenase-like cupin family protein